MPQHERGLYEPGEDVRVYDSSEEDEDVEGSRLPLLIVLALLVLAMFAGFVWLAYSEGVARGRGETPVITADAGPARVAPENPGGAAEPYKGFKIYEQPAPPDDDTAQAAAAPVSPPPATKPALTETPAPAPPAKVEAPAAPVKVAAAAPAPKPAPALKASQLPPQPAAPIGPATAPPRTLNTASAPVVAPPAPKPVAAAAPPAPSIPVASPPVASMPIAAGASVLQIGAYKSQADADRAWATYKTKHASLLAGYSPDVKQVDLGEKGTWFRLRIAGFPSKDVASALCDRLKADGGGCFLGK
ncbi:MAG: SPOR domain-containing protein [Rhizomicrobium sp.]